MDSLSSTITALGTLVAALGAFILAFRNSQKADTARLKAALAAEAALVAKAAAMEATQKIVVVEGRVVEVGKQIDGRLSQLLEMTAKLSRAEGVLEGVAEERTRGVQARALSQEDRAEGRDAATNGKKPT